MEREKERILLPAGSLLKSLQPLGLNQAEFRSEELNPGL